MWLSGARSPLAPTLPCSGTSGTMPALSSATSGVHQLRPDAAGGTEEDVGAQQHDGAHHLGAGTARRRRRRGFGSG